MILSAGNITKSYDGTDVLKNISFGLEPGDKLAVTGANGAGKTTLLKLIAGEEKPDGGSIAVNKDIRIGYLPQEAVVDSENTIYDEVLRAKGHLIEIESRLRALEEDITSGGDEAKLRHYSALSEIYDLENGYAVHSLATGILKGMGFREEEFGRKVSELSGGQKTRLALSRVLFSRPDILMLDEPTNHLDIDSADWLEGYLKSLKGTVIIVSHDRFFLDRIVNKVLDIENRRGTLYTGNYTSFAAKKEKLRKDRIRAYLNNQAEIKHQEEVIEKLRAFNREKSVKRAESREKALAKLKRVEKPFTVDDAMRLRFNPGKQSGKDVLFADNIKMAYAGKILFDGVDLSVRKNERIAVIGANGAGKTTFLKILAGVTAPIAGEVEYGIRVEPGYYDQEQQVLDPDTTVFEEIQSAFPEMDNSEVRNLLASFLFTGDDVFKLVRELSGGEKGRLSLAGLMLGGANLLLLDEPTNHLDAVSREILEEALINYTGTVIFVSHDRYFINRTATRILELKDRHFINFDGNYDYYLRKRSDPLFNEEDAVCGHERHVDTLSPAVSSPYGDRSAEPAVSKGKSDFARQKERKRELQKLSSRLKSLEENIMSSEKALENIERKMSMPGIASDHAELYRLSKEQSDLNSALMEFYSDWDSLSEELNQYESRS